jgi:hypothetical protein
MSSIGRTISGDGWSGDVAECGVWYPEPTRLSCAPQNELTNPGGGGGLSHCSSDRLRFRLVLSYGDSHRSSTVRLSVGCARHPICTASPEVFLASR